MAALIGQHAPADVRMTPTPMPTSWAIGAVVAPRIRTPWTLFQCQVRLQKTPLPTCISATRLVINESGDEALN
eukprot:scaffold2498_cov114-Isochrysis_galbana.AAC.8